MKPVGCPSSSFVCVALRSPATTTRMLTSLVLCPHHAHQSRTG
jgi:hypothetical protein